MPKGLVDPNHRSRCVAHKKDGERCKKAAIKGGKVCRSHGGAAPQVQRSARERFNDSIDPMLNAMAQMAKEIAEGTISAEDRRFFMKFVADRTGFIPGKTVSVDGPAAWEVTLKHIIMEVPDDLEDATPALSAGAGESYPQPSIEDVMDAEVVEEDHDPRAALPQIRPGLGENNRAGIVLGSANPPERPGYRR